MSVCVCVCVCRWLNISIGEIAGADEEATGLNAHWMELNNYTALHLAAASGARRTPLQSYEDTCSSMRTHIWEYEDTYIVDVGEQQVAAVRTSEV